MKDYIVLFSDTFLWFSKLEGLFYNSKEKTIFNFHCNNLIYKYCIDINDPINLYSVVIDNTDRQDSLFSSWIDHIVKNKMGIIHSMEGNVKKLFSLPPILNLSNKIEESQLDKSKYYSSINIAECLNEISFFLGGEELPTIEREYYKQILYPYSHCSFLELNKIRSFLEISNITCLRQINIICTSLLKYPIFEDLVRLLVSYGISVTCYMKGKNVDTLMKISDILKDTDFILKIYFCKLENFIKIQTYIKNCGIKYNWIFLIKNEDDLFLCEKLISEHSLEQADILPVVTNNNIDFFKENVFTSLDDMDNTSLTKQNIFCNQVLNSNYWGHLFILPEGNVYGNLNKKPLGTVKEDAMGLIKREVYDPNSTWKCTREKVMPCKECIYRNLCPPPSSYEFYLNTFNLCTIR